jgi:hypothetical protein
MSVPTGVKISALPPAEAANDTDQMEVNQGGISRRVTVSQIASVANASVFNVLNVRDDFGAVGDGETDDTAAFTAAGACGRTVRVPEGEYYIPDGAVAVSDNTQFIGDNRNTSFIRIGDTTPASLFNIGASTNVLFRNLLLAGNQVTQPSDTSGSCAISGTTGCTNVVIDNCIIIDWTQHGINLEGVTRADIRNNLVRRCYNGAGIRVAGTDIKVTNNTVTHTHQGNIHSVDGVDGWVVTGNYCDTTAWGSVVTSDIADNITGYHPAGSTAKNYVLANNVCVNSGNNGIHVGAPSMTLSNNVIANPVNAGIVLWQYPNTDPGQAKDVVITGNKVSFASNLVASHTGIGVRNTTGFTVTGNVIRDAYKGIEIRVEDPDVSGNTVSSGTIVGNTTINARAYSLEFSGTAAVLNGILVDGNNFHGDSTNGTSEDIRYNTTSTPDQIVVGSNYSSGAVVQLRKLQLTSGTGAISPALKAVGSPTDLNIVLLPKGAGVVYIKTDAVIGTASTSQAFFKATSTSPNLGFYYGNGTPNAVLSAGKGSFYTQVDATTTTTRLWVNTNGASAWTNLTTAA